ncbi:hypothetical protein DNK44_04380 [Pseudomonas dryadis]|uniref:Uncharacterized protein n=1 Tax=Phytopseudomonas dryadis TaxID=2487520 RepID=A0A4Q9R9G3_9GAMM|nr:hypothetical protein DNK44_04380 [Pseudomonas dryadis]
MGSCKADGRPLQAASCKLQAASCKLQAASCKLQASVVYASRSRSSFCTYLRLVACSLKLRATPATYGFPRTRPEPSAVRPAG